LYLIAKGAVQYEWYPKEAISIDTGGAFIYLFAPTSVMVVGKDEFGCTDSAEQTYNNIIRCCNLSYPSAFTPNNDGYNDGWKVVTYGNMQRFEVAIFNRFGQRVFSSNDPAERWEGTFLGQPCEIGTYYFMLDAQCLTGPKKTYKGDITLIR
jgi:gliding motility-associated-like protein